MYYSDLRTDGNDKVSQLLVANAGISVNVTETKLISAVFSGILQAVSEAWREFPPAAKKQKHLIQFDAVLLDTDMRARQRIYRLR